MDFPYLAKVTKLNVAALAAIASAPPPPEPKVEGAVSTDTTVTWARVPPGARLRRSLASNRRNEWQQTQRSGRKHAIADSVATPSACMCRRPD